MMHKQTSSTASGPPSPKGKVTIVPHGGENEVCLYSRTVEDAGPYGWR